MLHLVIVDRTNDGALTLAYGGRRVTINRERFEALAQTDPATHRALRYSHGSALLAPGKFDRLDEKLRWDAFLAANPKPALV